MSKKIKVLRDGIVYKSNGKLPYNGWPSVTKLPDGALAAVWSGNRLKHVCPFGKTVISYSKDEGKTWSGPAEVVNTPFDDRDGGIVVKGNQVLVTSFNNNYNFQIQDVKGGGNAEHINIIESYLALMQKTEEHERVGSMIVVSEDGGYTFSQPYYVPITCPHGPIVLEDGRYCYVGRSFSIHPRDRVEGVNYDFLDEGIYYMFSSDGYTWTKPERIPLPELEGLELYCEPHVIQTKDGELLVQIRTHFKGEGAFGTMHIYQTKSTNGMRGWTKAFDIGVDGSPPELIRHSSGTIVCVYGKRSKPFGEMAILSDDEGETWSEPVCIDGSCNHGDMGYPSTVELDDGSMLTLYYQHEKPNEPNFIKYTVWTLE